MIVRATVSQMIKKLAPNNIDTGIKILRSDPTNNRAICGTISPTKPIGPVIETTIPVINDAVIKPILWVRGTSTPLLVAEWTPVLMRLRSRPTKTRRPMPKNTMGAMERTVW